MLRVTLVGAGGHAKAVVEAIRAGDHVLAAYVDPKPCNWLGGLHHFQTDESCQDDAADGFVMGLGAVSPEGLAWRLAMFDQYRARGWDSPAMRHPKAVVSDGAAMQAGSMVLAGAVVQPGAVIGEASIVNTASVVEHDSRIGRGAHVAPGAIVLGGCDIGDGAMIGAGAVVLPGVAVPPGTMVPALKRFSG